MSGNSGKRRKPRDGSSETAGLIKLADAIDEDDPDYQAFLRRWGTRYSPRNLQLLWVQCPHATSLHTYQVWAQAGLQVRKGEKSIKMFRPRTKVDPKKITEQNPNGDKVTGISLMSLFDISQCDLIEPVATDDPDLLAELKRLRMEAADKHPDRGGTAEEFMAAWQRYEDAKAKAAGRAA
jgi:N-terminal domain of anti-restriction factor ArdC